jgi:hypothetical protein
VVGALRNAGQGGEPRDRQLGCRSQGLEVCEGTRSTYSEPFCQIRNCTVASANASLSSWISAGCRRSTWLPRLPALPGIPSSIAALPASTNRVAPPVDRLCRHPKPACRFGDDHLVHQHGEHQLQPRLYRHRVIAPAQDRTPCHGSAPKPCQKVDAHQLLQPGSPRTAPRSSRRPTGWGYRLRRQACRVRLRRPCRAGCSGR